MVSKHSTTLELLWGKFQKISGKSWQFQGCCGAHEYYGLVDLLKHKD